MTDKRQFPFYLNDTKGRDAWCNAAIDYYLDNVATGKTHADAVKWAIMDADADADANVLES